MAEKLSDLSVSELRARYAGDGSRVSPQVLSRLRRDPRRGVRQLHAVLKRREERRRDEELRLDAMLNFERVLWKTGMRRIAGVDEAGVGPLAGPVVAAAVVFPPGTEAAGTPLHGVDDSKRLDAATRDELAAAIRQRAAAVAVGVATVAEVDRVNVYQAGLLAMRRAVEALAEPPQHVLVDAREIPGVAMPQNPFDKGDGINFSIAAASIIAKTHRDALMVELDRAHPEYGFRRHKGYGTAEHQEAIRRHGPCDAHRLSYPVLRELCGEFSQVFYELRAALEEVWQGARERGGSGDGGDRSARRRALRAWEKELARRAGALADEEAHKLKLLLRRAWDAL